MTCLLKIACACPLPPLHRPLLLSQRAAFPKSQKTRKSPHLTTLSGHAPCFPAAVLEAKGLACDRSGQCNAYVIFHYNQGEKKQSPYVRRTPNPVWNLRYELDIRTSCKPLLVDVAVKFCTSPFALSLSFASFD